MTRIALLALLALALAAPARATDQVSIMAAGHDGSTTITAGGTAQTLFSGTVPANGYLVANPNATDDCWVSDTATAAANAAGSHRVAANGGEYRTPLGYRPVQAVSVVCAATGDKITAIWW